jgi:hypothetical protein
MPAESVGWVTLTALAGAAEVSALRHGQEIAQHILV